MHKLRVLFLTLTLLVMACGVLPSRAQEPTPTPLPPPLTFSIWHSWQSREAELLNALVKQYQEANPNVTIETRYFDNIVLLDEVLEAIRRDQGPDVFIGPSSWAYRLAMDQRVAPLGERLDKDFREQVAGKAWDTVRVNDFLYGIPESLSTVTLYYNPELANADQLPKTFDQLIAANPDMMFDTATTIGVYLGLGGTLINPAGEATIDSQALQTYLDTLQGAFNKLKAADALFTRDRVPVSTDRRFRDARTPFLVDGSWKADDLYTANKERVQVAPLPLLPNGSTWKPLISSQVFYVNINALQPDGALRFLKYVTGVEGQSRVAQYTGRIPVNPKAEPGLYTAVLLKQVEDGVAARHTIAVVDRAR
jgi:maltose-binding protein MalE